MNRTIWRWIFVCLVVALVNLAITLESKAADPNWYATQTAPYVSVPVVQPSSTTIYQNGYGRITGSATQSGGTTTYYDAYGKPVGSSYNPSYPVQPQTNPYLPPAGRIR